jgi:3-dehydroquinate dehydratase II
MVRILILHGLGMNMRGKVKQDIYGHETLAQYDERIAASAKCLGLSVDIFQSNIEGELVNKLYEGDERDVAGAVLNPAGFSIGYRGLTVAITQLRYPVVEAHVSNPLLRGIVSDVSKVCKATVTGFGIESYVLAMNGLRSLVERSTQTKPGS